jgi:hypothetical protein
MHLKSSYCSFQLLLVFAIKKLLLGTWKLYPTLLALLPRDKLWTHPCRDDLVPTSVFSLGAMLCYSQSGNHPQECIAKFGYKLNVKVIFFKNSSYSFGYLLESLFRNLAIFLKTLLNSSY